MGSGGRSCGPLYVEGVGKIGHRLLGLIGRQRPTIDDPRPDRRYDLFQHRWIATGIECSSHLFDDCRRGQPLPTQLPIGSFPQWTKCLDPGGHARAAIFLAPEIFQQPLGDLRQEGAKAGLFPVLPDPEPVVLFKPVQHV